MVSRWEKDQGSCRPRREQLDALRTLAEVRKKPKGEQSQLKKHLLVASAMGLTVSAILPFGLAAMTSTRIASRLRSLLDTWLGGGEGGADE